MEKEVKPYYEDDYQSLDEMSTIDLLEMKDDALAEYSDIEHLVNRINQRRALRGNQRTSRQYSLEA